MKFRTALLVSMCCTAVGCSGRASEAEGLPAAEDKFAAEVHAALEAYDSGTPQGKDEAKQAFQTFTEAHVPALRKIMESTKGRYAMLSGAALAYMRDDASFELLIDALNGDTALEARRLAASAMLDRISGQGLSPERMHSFEKLQPAVVSYLKKADGGLDLQQGIRLAMMVGCKPCLPVLRKCTEHEDLQVRLLAARAIKAISGQAVNVDVPQERFAGVELDESLLSVVQSIEIDEGTLTSAAIAPVTGRIPGIIASIHSSDNEAERCQVVEFDSTGGRRVLFDSALFLSDIIVNPIAEPADEVPWLVARAAEDSGMSSSTAIAFNKDGKELWRFELPSGYREFKSIVWQFGDHGITGVVLWCGRLRQKDTLLWLDLSGQELRRADVDFSSFKLVSHPCVPDCLLRGTAGYGSARLLDTTGKMVAESPDPSRNPSIFGMAFLTMGDSVWGIVTSRRGPNSTPDVACFDKGFNLQWAVTLSRPVLALGTLADGCDERGYVVAATEDSEVLLIDADGKLRWRQHLWPDATPKPLPVYRLDSVPGSDRAAPALVIYTESRAALLVMHN